MPTENAKAGGPTASLGKLDVIAFVDQLADPAIIVGPDRVIFAANSRIDKLFGWEEEGLTGKMIDVLIPSTVSASHPDWVSAFFERPASRSMSENPLIQGVRKNGERVQVDVSLTPLHDLGSPFVLAIIHDTSKTADSYSNRVAELSVLAGVSRLTGTMLDAQAALQRLSRQIRHLIQYDRLTISRIDSAALTSADIFITGEPADGDESWNRRTLSEDDLRVFKDLSQPLIVRRTDTGKSHFSTHELVGHRFDLGMDSLLVAPLIWNDEVIGILRAHSKSRTAYDEETLQIAEQISSIVAMILAKSDLQATAAAAAEKQVVLSEISRTISNSNDFRKTFDSIAVLIDQLIPIDRMVLIALNSAKTGYFVEAEWGPKDPNMRPGVGKRIQGTATEQAVLIGSAFILPAEQILTISRHNHPADTDPAPMNSWIVSPIKIRGEVIGVIHFRSADRWLYDRTHLDYAEQISAFFAGAVDGVNSGRDNARERQIRSAVITLNRHVIEGKSIKALAQIARDELAEIVDFDRFSAESIGSEMTGTTTFYQAGVDIDGGNSGDSLPFSERTEPGSSLVGRVDELPSPWNENLANAGLNSYMYMAIGEASGEPVGAIWVASKLKGAFNQRDQEAFERFGGVLTSVFQGNALEVTSLRLAVERVRSETLSAHTMALESDAAVKSEFISSISHEFKTPLTSVVAFSGRLKRDKNMSPRQLRHIELIQNNAWRLERMIDDLLHVATADSGRLTYDIRPTRVADLVEEVCDGLMPIAHTAGKRLVCRASRSNAEAAVDPMRLAQAIQNVVNNAIKYSPAATGITVSTCDLDGNIEILVRNKGSLTKAETKQVFDRFTRLDNEITRSTPGTGLGLWITREILNVMGGTATVDSKQGIIEARLTIPIPDPHRS